MKFKVGDKVRMVKEYQTFHVGDIVEITVLYPEGNPPHYRADSESDYWYVNDSQIEKAVPIAPTLTTRPHDYTGCHPQIAEALKQGLDVLCEVWDEGRPSNNNTAYVTNYENTTDYPYRAQDDSGCRLWFSSAEPVKPRRKILRPIEETVPLLLQNGYMFVQSGMELRKEDGTSTFTLKWLSDKSGSEVGKHLVIPNFLIEDVEVDE